MAESKSDSLVNHICFVVDRSGSMSSIKPQVVRVFNEQLKTVQRNAKSAGQETFFSTFMFHSKVDAPRHFAAPVARVPKLAAKDFKPTGLTALQDAVGTAITRLQKAKGAKDKNTSFLLIVITDGAENNSRHYKTKLKGLIQQVQKTGRWSLAFLVPPGNERSLTRFGIPKGNVTSWDATVKGTKVMDEKLSAGLSTFYKARASGQKSVNAFFTTDMTKVDIKSLTGLKNVSKGFSQWTVDKERSIREFVNGKLQASPALRKKLGNEYKPGKGFYELTKPETIQPRKNLAIMDKATKAIFGGDHARKVLGMPGGANVRVKPGNHLNYAIFVESTSTNRKLVRGTTLLYQH
ncbi:vWA domain-containing protein [Hyalangium rubrum]|uniref:VWA domain-containing protein n=1 Tax=Hyalangium rubrum TaxID=3103134 RepID=A0ABU5H2V7_9BACT|nr:vWA domain-containing protein [Hyalangium sp. s54d21]MDY7226435.1 vWA domain-containing protein [Hyalangium sp. s54d21]